MNAPPHHRHRRSTGLASLLVAAGLASLLMPGAAAAAPAPTPAPPSATSVQGEETAAPARLRDAIPEQPWRWPVAAPIRVVAPFRAPPTPYTAGHRGIDIASAPETPVGAPAPGVVSFAGMVAGRPVVAIDHGDGVVSAIEPVAALVVQGTSVAAGDPIGTVATGGHCGSSCVHFGVRVDGEYVSPFLFFGGLPRAVLLPPV
ncbi:murein hydrolase activator EnvC family protein [Agromyces laixinhei]|uniref:murein hydrolase activator EnvC family protein n=1 Tax=Agromyces laixinhei TaxID=2585717 RepID=UPI00143D48C5|nr:M23 family metallopeptidase [Agromyces laixinhei]